VLKHVAHKNGLSSVAALTIEFQTVSGSNVSTITVRRELREMSFVAEQLPKSLTSPCAMPSVSWSYVKLAAIELRSSNAFSVVMNHASPSGSLTDKSGFGECQEKAT
jgi:hypothetical protein